EVRDLLGAEALDVAQGEHGPWALGERGDRRAQALARVERREAPLGVVPGAGRRGPVAGPCVALALEAVRRDRRLALLARPERRERHGAQLADAAGLGLVGQDVEQPGLERRAVLEPVDAVDHRQPRL